MKTELRAVPHTVLPGETIIELWWEGAFIGQVTGADGPGVRVISKHQMSLTGREPLVIQVNIHP